MPTKSGFELSSSTSIPNNFDRNDLSSSMISAVVFVMLSTNYHLFSTSNATIYWGTFLPRFSHQLKFYWVSIKSWISHIQSIILIHQWKFDLKCVYLFCDRVQLYFLLLLVKNLFLIKTSKESSFYSLINNIRSVKFTSHFALQLF